MARLRKVFARRKPIQDLLRQVQGICSRVQEFERDPVFEHINARLFISGIYLLDWSLRSILPHVTCPECQGAGCGRCLERGWLDEWSCTRPAEANPPTPPPTGSGSQSTTPVAEAATAAAEPPTPPAEGSGGPTGSGSQSAAPPGEAPVAVAPARLAP